MIEKIQQILRQQHADKDAWLTQTTIAILEKRPCKDNTTQSKQTFVSGHLDSSVSQQTQLTIKQKLKQIGIRTNLKVRSPTNIPFKNYGQIQNVFDEDKSIIQHRAGEILVINVWATYSSSCDKTMQYIQDMLQIYRQKWEDKVRIFGISVDQNKQKIKNKIKQKQWNKMTHLTLKEWNMEHPLIKDFKIQGLPYVCLVDKEGIINYLGNPSHINLQQRIKQLLTGNKNEQTLVTSEQKNVFLNTQKLNKQFINQQFKDIQLFCMKYHINRRLQNQKIYSSPNVKVYINKNDQLAHLKTKSLFKSIHKQLIQINQVNYIQIPQIPNPQCFQCANQLNYPFYWLKWQDNKFGCISCVQAIQANSYKYKQNSILLMAKHIKIPQKSIGKNLQPHSIDQIKNMHLFQCDGCQQNSKSINQPRYVSLGCHLQPNFKRQLLDLCHSCMTKVISGNQQLTNKLKTSGHLPHHPFLRILYKTNGYFQF